MLWLRRSFIAGFFVTVPLIVSAKFGATAVVGSAIV